MVDCTEARMVVAALPKLSKRLEYMTSQKQRSDRLFLRSEKTIVYEDIQGHVGVEVGY